MNKYVFLAVFLCALASTNAKPSHDKEEGSDSPSATGESEFKKIAEQVNERYNTTVLLDIGELINKVDEKCPNLEKQMDNVAEEIHNCIDDIELGNDTLCHAVQENFVTCFKPVAVLINSCMPEESKDLPFMLGKMVQGLITQACHSTVEEILEIFNPCIYEADTDTLPACEEVETVVNEHKSKLPSKSLICHTLPKERNCAKSMVEGTCKNPITKNTVIKFHDAVEHAIKEDCDALNKA
ncbi:unnamed protein product [Psylliodes chrysocephalus]|uniref:Uncharacterized protein n=1 Tax=Psylliodes chrysocephalus TaxID=3402493 RepID=A0A9P0CD73_9CUCU|nr:unnamed protein product [Psylliodes chrysocephala]